MPKDTSFRLPEGKRTPIRDVTIDEFDEYASTQTSTNCTVAKVGNSPISHSAIGTLLQYAFARGGIRKKIDIKIFLYVIASMSVAIIEYRSKFAPQGMDASAIEAVDAFVDFFKNGIGAQREETQMPQFAPQDQHF
jgi:hypothetical protein